MTLHGYGFSYIWPESSWFQSKAIIVFANATIMFAALFTRSLLPIKNYSYKLDRVTNAISWVCGLSIIAGFVLPYWLMIKAFLLLLSLVVIFVLSLGVWLSLKREVVARYFTTLGAFY